ncbi:Protein of unknown function [Salinihabitans flavidus]|uniref:DUF3168 domain-containing protein n=1 Tax=Salinihabitans flavidus TaxID=569882 RepID=A0A1H8Q9C6_9RHOB|nr:DUF3168 domain-containing protein [Salinihabitans flavidus]SEO50666.1 Protein of unknown function [Salinihabitans flavidus]
MSYAVASALQAAVYQHLAADAALDALIGDAIFDQVPSGTPPPTYVALGPETARDRSDKTGAAAEHRLVISVITDSAGFSVAKDVAVAVSDALGGADLALSRGRLVSLNFDRATAKREESGALRRIDLRFRARVEDN